MLAKEITQCIEDMQNAAKTGRISLDMQIRAYDLLDKLLEISNIGIVGPAEAFREEYYNLEADLKNAYKEEELKKAAEETVAPYIKALETAAENAHKSTILHEAAKQTLEIWRTGGFFERNKALKNLRKLAGFRLESNRIGNFVAKTFDLMNEANMKCAQAQQALFNANISYKIKPGLYSKIASALSCQ